MKALPILTLALLLAGGPGARAQQVNDPTLELTLVASDISFPTSMAFIGEADFLILEKATGRVRRVLDGTLLDDPVLDVVVHGSSERGLLGIATHPDFQNNGYIYLFVTEGSTEVDNFGDPAGNRVYRYRWDDPLLVEPMLILNLPVLPGPNHNGGIVAFGPDDRLHVIIGDLNHNGQLQNTPDGPAPDDTGVILRVGDRGQAVADNPFFDPTDPTNPLGRYFAYGIRNSFGMTFDPVSGDLWQTENGPASFDEINRFDPGSNSGWRRIMGPDERDPQGVDDLWEIPGSTYVDPQFSWAATVAPTAVAFAESRVMGCNNEHVMFVGDNNCGQIYRFELQADRKNLELAADALLDRVADNGNDRCNEELQSLQFATGFDTLTDIENGPDGALYVVTPFPSRVWRIGPRPGAFADGDADGVADACDCDPSNAGAFAAPTEVPRLRLAGGSNTTLGWDSQRATAGNGTTSSIVSGSLATLREDDGFQRACTLAEGLIPAQTRDPRADPPPGEARYYLVRTGNSCDPGSFGRGSTPAARALLDAAMPLACEP